MHVLVQPALMRDFICMKFAAGILPVRRCRQQLLRIGILAATSWEMISILGAASNKAHRKLPCPRLLLTRLLRSKSALLPDSH